MFGSSTGSQRRKEGVLDVVMIIIFRCRGMCAKAIMNMRGSVSYEERQVKRRLWKTGERKGCLACQFQFC